METECPDPSAHLESSGAEEVERWEEEIAEAIQKLRKESETELGPVLDLRSRFQAEIAELIALHQRKGMDYATEEDEHLNFRIAANQMGYTAWQQCEAMVAHKQSRMRELYPWRTGKTPRNESIRETLIDRAVFSIIAVCLYDDEYKEQ